MTTNRLVVLGAVLAFSSTSVYAGPCNTASRDAGSGNVPGYTEQTTGSTPDSKQHPPTSSMSKASEHTATSSEDAQRQMQSQPTAAEQSTTTQAAPSAESRTVGIEQTRPVLTEQSKRATAGAAQPAPSQKKPGDDC
jgi:hypothetical protein